MSNPENDELTWFAIDPALNEGGQDGRPLVHYAGEASIRAALGTSGVGALADLEAEWIDPTGESVRDSLVKLLGRCPFPTLDKMPPQDLRARSVGAVRAGQLPRGAVQTNQASAEE